MRTISPDGQEIPSHCAATVSHYRSTFYVHNTGLKGMQRAKDRVQTRYKVVYMQGEIMCIDHQCFAIEHLKSEVRKLVGRPTTCIETVRVGQVRR